MLKRILATVVLVTVSTVALPSAPTPVSAAGAKDPCRDLSRMLNLTQPLNLCDATQLTPLGEFWSENAIIDVPFATCQDARAFVLDPNTHMGHAAYGGFGSTIRAEALANNRVHLTYVAIPRATGYEISLFRPTWTEMTRTQTDAVDDWLDLMRKHEAGHQNLEVSVIDAYRPDVTKRFKNASDLDTFAGGFLASHDKRLGESLVSAQALYEGVTQNGITQEDVGGESTRLLNLCHRITPEVLPDATKGQAYAVQFQMFDGGQLAPQPVAWALASGNLPSGLDLLPSGDLTGMPGEDGSFRFTVAAVDAAGGTASVDLALEVKKEPLVTLYRRTDLVRSHEMFNGLDYLLPNHVCTVEEYHWTLEATRTQGCVYRAVGVEDDQTSTLAITPALVGTFSRAVNSSLEVTSPVGFTRSIQTEAASTTTVALTDSSLSVQGTFFDQAVGLGLNEPVDWYPVGCSYDRSCPTSSPGTSFLLWFWVPVGTQVTYAISFDCDQSSRIQNRMLLYKESSRINPIAQWAVDRPCEASYVGTLGSINFGLYVFEFNSSLGMTFSESGVEARGGNFSLLLNSAPAP